MMNRRLMKYRLAAAATVLAVVAATTACGITGSRGNGDDNYFSAFHTFTSREWNYAEPVTFRVDTLRDSIARGGGLLLSVRHTGGYRYGNLWLELSYPLNDSVMQVDTLNIILADDYGHWLGHGIGPSVQHSDTVARGIDIARGMEIKLRHIMRLDTLANIEQVGIVFLPKF